MKDRELSKKHNKRNPIQMWPIINVLHLNMQNSLIMSPLWTKGDIIVLVWFFFRFCFFYFFSAKLVRTITFLSFEIGQWYLVRGCMIIRRCVAYHNELCWTLTFDLKSNNCFLNSIIQVCGCMTIRRCVTYCNDLRETLTVDLKVI